MSYDNRKDKRSIVGILISGVKNCFRIPIFTAFAGLCAYIALYYESEIISDASIGFNEDYNRTTCAKPAVCDAVDELPYTQSKFFLNNALSCKCYERIPIIFSIAFPLVLSCFALHFCKKSDRALTFFWPFKSRSVNIVNNIFGFVLSSAMLACSSFLAARNIYGLTTHHNDSITYRSTDADYICGAVAASFVAVYSLSKALTYIYDILGISKSTTTSRDDTVYENNPNHYCKAQAHAEDGESLNNHLYCTACGKASSSSESSSYFPHTLTSPQ